MGPLWLMSRSHGPLRQAITGYVGMYRKWRVYDGMVQAK